MGTHRLTASWTVSYVHLHSSNISYCSKFRYIRFRAFTVDAWENLQPQSPAGPCSGHFLLKTRDAQESVGMLFRVSRIIRELQIRGRENRYPAKLHRTFDPPETLALLSLLKEVKPSPDRKIIKLLTFDNSSSATTTLESFRFYCVLRTREPGSFWRENVIAVVTLPPGLARMSWWQEKVIKCKKLFDFAIGSFSINK